MSWTSPTCSARSFIPLDDVGRPKLDSAAEKLAAINPFVNVRKFETRLTSANALEIFRDFDIIADGTDNFPTRYLVNDACVLSGKPNVYASIFRFEGQASVFATEQGPCYRCLYPEPPPPGLVPSCAEGGVLGILPGIAGRDPGNRGHQADSRLRRSADWASAAGGRAGHALPRAAFAQESGLPGLRRESHDSRTDRLQRVLRHSRGGSAATTQVPEIQPTELRARLDAGDDLFILDVREPHEYQICNLGGHLIPLGDLPARMNELDSSREIVVHCRSGVRSAKAVTLLRQAGFSKVKNLAGGILAWSDKVDPTVPKY